MKTTDALVNRLKEVLTEGKWVTGTNYLDQITHTSWKDATKSVHELNSIANLTFHISYYLEGVANVLEGGELNISDKFSFDAPPVQSEKDWTKLVEKFKHEAERFIELVKKIPTEKLSECFIDEKYGNYQRNIDLMIEHCYYHLGQILIIKKLLNKIE